MLPRSRLAHKRDCPGVAHPSRRVAGQLTFQRRRRERGHCKVRGKFGPVCFANLPYGAVAAADRKKAQRMAAERKAAVGHEAVGERGERVALREDGARAD